MHPLKGAFFYMLLIRVHIGNFFHLHLIFAFSRLFLDMLTDRLSAIDNPLIQAVCSVDYSADENNISQDVDDLVSEPGNQEKDQHQNRGQKQNNADLLVGVVFSHVIQELANSFLDRPNVAAVFHLEASLFIVDWS